MSTFKLTFYKAGETGGVQGNTLTALEGRDSTAGFAVYGGSNEQNQTQSCPPAACPSWA